MAIVTVIVIVIPIVLSLPAVFLAVPPLVILTPAAFPFGIEIAPTVFGLGAALAFVLDRRIQSRFRLLDGVLTLSPVVGLHARG